MSLARAVSRRPAGEQRLRIVGSASCFIGSGGIACASQSVQADPARWLCSMSLSAGPLLAPDLRVAGRLNSGVRRALSTSAASGIASAADIGSSAGSALERRSFRSHFKPRHASAAGPAVGLTGALEGSGFWHSPWRCHVPFRSAPRATKLRKQRRLGRLLHGLRRHSVRLTNRSSRPRSTALIEVVVDWDFLSSRSARCGSA